MPKIKGFDPQVIDTIEIEQSKLTDPVLVDTVSNAMNRLDPGSQQLIYEIFYQGHSLSGIASRDGIPLNELNRRFYEIKRQLKMILGDFVKNRWGLNVTGTCRICSHPRKEAIDRVILAKNDSESWGQICKNLESITGEKFYPPQILKAHLKHISSVNNGGNSNGK